MSARNTTYPHWLFVKLTESICLGNKWKNSKENLWCQTLRVDTHIWQCDFGISLDIFEFFRFGLLFPFLIFFLVLCILGPPYCGIGATIRIGREIRCLPYAGFLKSCYSKTFLKLKGHQNCMIGLQLTTKKKTKKLVWHHTIFKGPFYHFKINYKRISYGEKKMQET